MPSLLIVDDEPSIRESLGLYLQGRGFDLRTAASQAEALDSAGQRKPDLILSDLMLGHGSGLALKQEMSRRYPEQEPGFVLMTAYASLDSAVQAMDLGVDRLLLKPLDLAKLDDALDQTLKRKKTRQSSGLKVRFEKVEEFYHDLTLPLNQLISRLCILLEARQASLSISQSHNISQQFECLRRLLWLMRNFYTRLLEAKPEASKRRALGLANLTRGLAVKLEDEAAHCQVELDFGLPQGSHPAFVAAESAELLLEAVALRALAIAPAGSVLRGHWEEYPERADWLFKLEVPKHAPPSLLSDLLPLIPFSQTCLEQAGLSYEAAGPAGPWILGYSLLHN